MSVSKRKHKAKKLSKEKIMEPSTSITQPVIVSSGLSSKLPFKKSRLLVIVAIFAVIGIIALVMSFALTPNNGDFEAETMTLEAL